MQDLYTVLKSIKPVSEEIGKKAESFWDLLAHPAGSLGELEGL